MTSRRLRGEDALRHSSSHSSISSGKRERLMRADPQRDVSMTKSLTPQSSSSDADREERQGRGARQTRQQKHKVTSLEGTNDKHSNGPEDEDADGDGEVTRCVCGQLEYPGPPVPLSDNGRNHNSKDNGNPASLAAAEGLPEDAGGLFIQCDTCHVWQHGGCVGIMQEELSPDNYYCERCRKDLHRLQTGARNQRYSRYLPIVDAASLKTPRRPSAAKDSDSRSSREADANRSGQLSSAKRRSTMNSRRDLEEEEMLRKAIEQSKSVDGTVTSGTGNANGQRRSKRGRDEDNDDSREDIKRRKTGSESITPPAIATAPADDSSAGETPAGRSRSNTNTKKPRNAVVQVQRERQLREREKEREAERLEAAGRRRGRADRRRVDESELPEESIRPPPNPRSTGPAKSQRPSASSRPSSNAVPTASSSHKKKSSAKKGRVGRNQYTKGREQQEQASRASPRPSNSRGSEDRPNGQDAAASISMGNGSKPSKPRHMNPNRTSMNDLRKRAAGILEYITRTQVEMAGSGTPSSKDKDSSGSTTPSSKSKTNGGTSLSKLSSELDCTKEDEQARRDLGAGVDEERFKHLSSLEMMDVLTRELVFWQKDFGKYGEKT